MTDAQARMRVVQRTDERGVAFGCPKVYVGDVEVANVVSVSYDASAGGFPEVNVVVSAAMADVDLEGYGRIMAEPEATSGTVGVTSLMHHRKEQGND